MYRIQSKDIACTLPNKDQHGEEDKNSPLCNTLPVVSGKISNMKSWKYEKTAMNKESNLANCYQGSDQTISNEFKKGKITTVRKLITRLVF